MLLPGERGVTTEGRPKQHRQDSLGPKDGPGPEVDSTVDGEQALWVGASDDAASVICQAARLGGSLAKDQVDGRPAKVLVLYHIAELGRRGGGLNKTPNSVGARPSKRRFVLERRPRREGGPAARRLEALVGLRRGQSPAEPDQSGSYVVLVEIHGEVGDKGGGKGGGRSRAGFGHVRMGKFHVSPAADVADLL